MDLQNGLTSKAEWLTYRVENRLTRQRVDLQGRRSIAKEKAEFTRSQVDVQTLIIKSEVWICMGYRPGGEKGRDCKAGRTNRLKGRRVGRNIDLWARLIS